MSDMKKVTLVLSDGTKFHGKSFGYDAPVAGEVVFNTAMMGYPESLTDPSYAGQLMTLTFPLVGNYGVPPFTFEENGLPTFMESDKIYASAIIVNDYQRAVQPLECSGESCRLVEARKGARNHRHRHP